MALPTPGSTNFTSGFGCSNGIFCDVTQANRTNQWAFDILNAATGEVVEPVASAPPGALPLFATGLGALGLLGWRRKRKAQAVA